MSYNLLPDQDYQDDLYKVLLSVEEKNVVKFSVYVDAKIDGNPTIGVGMNLRDDNVRQEVIYNMIGLNPIPTGLDSQISAIVHEKWDANQTVYLQNQLNNVMAQYHATYSYVPATFVFQTETQVRNTFDAISPTYEDKVDTWLNTDVPDSRERLALVSLAYNTKDGSTTLLGPSLEAAVDGGNRAEAWYQIRYQSNGDKLAGIAERRYYESQVYGLYQDKSHVTDKEAKDVYTMDERHQTFSQHPTITSYDNTYSGQIKFANQDYDLSVLGIGQPAGTVQNLKDSMAPAHDYLVNTYAHSAHIDNIYVDYSVWAEPRVYYLQSLQFLYSVHNRVEVIHDQKLAAFNPAYPTVRFPCANSARKAFQIKFRQQKI